jgi:hypothetical protein
MPLMPPAALDLLDGKCARVALFVKQSVQTVLPTLGKGLLPDHHKNLAARKQIRAHIPRYSE